MKKDDQNFWNFIYSVLFIVVFITLLYILLKNNGELPTFIPLFDLVLIILATFRLTRLFVYDKITRFIREFFTHREEISTEEGTTYFLTNEPESGPRRAAYDLLTCPWCFSVWAATFTVFFYFLTPYAWFPILVLAVSGVGSLIQITANMIGWKAEESKHRANSLKNLPR